MCPKREEKKKNKCPKFYINYSKKFVLCNYMHNVIGLVSQFQSNPKIAH